ncbi:MAG: hypothetical protein Fur0034_07130 [Desulfuromonadia bacterium]
MGTDQTERHRLSTTLPDDGDPLPPEYQGTIPGNLLHRHSETATPPGGAGGEETDYPRCKDENRRYANEPPTRWVKPSHHSPLSPGNPPYQPSDPPSRLHSTDLPEEMQRDREIAEKNVIIFFHLNPQKT